MTTANTAATALKTGEILRIPDPPERKPEDMTSFNQLNAPGSAHHLMHHYGNQDTTIIAGEHYVLPRPDSDRAGVMAPDLFIAFDADPADYAARNAYIISEQGKPPDFVLEIASPSTGRRDIREKRAGYAALGIPEYWRFDETGRYHRALLAGDRLVNGEYQPIDIERVAEEVWEGYSAVLDLNIRWERGQLRWHDPATGRHIATFADEREGRIREREGRIREREGRIIAEARAENAEARVRQLESEIRRLQDG